MGCFGFFNPENNRLNKDLAYINEIFKMGKIKPVIDGHYRLEEVPAAFKVFAEAAHKGKIVISVIDAP